MINRLKILVTGCNGQLGHELRAQLEQRVPGHTQYTDVDQLDIRQAEVVSQFVADGGFTHVINCAAYTNVERAEEEKSLCTAINVDGASNLARACAASGAKLLHISTDYVFDGQTHLPYAESAKPAPRSHYGSTKRKSETAIMGLLPEAIVMRTGWLYSRYGNNFAKTVLRRLRAAEKLRVVADQIGTPTSATDFARAIVDIVTAPQWLPGTYHFSNEGVASWYDFARAIADIAGFTDASITPIHSAEWQTAAGRPAFAVLDKTKIKVTYGMHIPYWRHSLEKCIREIVASEEHQENNA